jgi:rhamnosyltransferase
MKIAGAVVLYNPNINVVDNITSYITQIDILYVLDNSEKINNRVVVELKKNKNVKYIDNNGNLGIGVALNIAAKLAINEKYKYLLTMDQDSSAAPDMIESMNLTDSIIKNVGIISPVHVNKFNTQKNNDTVITEKFDVMASGNLVNLDAFTKVGGFNEEFFIDYVDVEFCLKMKLNDYKIIQVNSSKLFHEEANITKVKFFGKIFYPYNHSVVRLYYKTRNRLYLRKKYLKLFKEYFIERESKMYWNTIFKIILFEKNKIKKIGMVGKGFCDYLLNRSGKI